ncbi:MAG: sensor histidine kinase [Syntrophomonadaceae bacterium]
MRYRAAAYSAFDVDLRNNLETLRAALIEELNDVRQRPIPGQEGSIDDPLRHAANRTLDDFRLNGLYAEIRLGRGAESLLARLPGAGLRADQPLIPEGDGGSLAGYPPAHPFEIGPRRRGSVETFSAATEPRPITVVVADTTRLVDATLGSIRRALLEFGIAGLALAVAGGYGLAVRTLRPIDDLTTQASEMAARTSSAGSHRLDVPSPGDELGRLAMTFNGLLERIDTSVAQTRGFIADAAHELKTPIAIVRTEAELALSGRRQDEEYLESLRAIAAESARLSALVSDLSLLAEGQLLHNPLEYRLVDLTELLHEVVRSLRPLAENRGIQVEIDATGPSEFRGDERLLRRISMNLLENAIKFSPEGSRIGVAVGGEADRIELRVLDEAPTLTEEERGKVFERFYRSPRTSNVERTGSGLGLAIAQWAVRLHGGTIRVEPRRDGGNAFIVELPTDGAAAAGAA